MIEDNEAIANKVVHVFQSQFSEDKVPTSFGIIDHVPKIVTMDQNNNLLKQPTKEELKQAVYGRNGNSAAGPDGFTGCFFHICWDINGDDVFEVLRLSLMGMSCLDL